ncbi:MAG: hypothetical protein J2P21_15555 [Chloracidobacterium sp.]|nr:hypothetical protein [Chloracidobacterium sp.]
MRRYVHSTFFTLFLISIIASLALTQGENNPPSLRRVTLYKEASVISSARARSTATSR